MLTPEFSYGALLIVQALHLLHHRLAKRHISFAEVVSASALCIPPNPMWMPPTLLMSAHEALIAIQIIGSLWITKLSPSWEAGRCSSNIRC